MFLCLKRHHALFQTVLDLDAGLFIVSEACNDGLRNLTIVQIVTLAVPVGTDCEHDIDATTQNLECLRIVLQAIDVRVFDLAKKVLAIELHDFLC